MSQNTWIIGGGVVFIAIAGLLYMTNGDGVSKQKAQETSVPTPVVTQVEPEKILTTSSTSDMDITVQSAPVRETLPATGGGKTAIIHTSMGDITIKFFDKDAPKTVENFTKLASSGFYEGVKFHRVIKGFMDQTGDPNSKDDTKMAIWGQGGPGYKFADEIDASSALYQKGYKHGVVAMANSGPNTNGSQFFIMAADYRLQPDYTIFGEVTAGLNVVDAINAVQTDGNDRPLTPVSIKSVEIK